MSSSYNPLPQLRAGIMLLVYKKALTASTDASPPSGKIMTLLTSDVNIIGIVDFSLDSRRLIS